MYARQAKPKIVIINVPAQRLCASHYATRSRLLVNRRWLPKKMIGIRHEKEIKSFISQENIRCMTLILFILHISKDKG
jgi:hypothetical protein